MKHGAQYLRAGKVSLDTDEHNQKLRSVALLSPYRPGLVEAGPWEAGGTIVTRSLGAGLGAEGHKGSVVRILGELPGASKKR